jgi:hypothetical protein
MELIYKGVAPQRGSPLPTATFWGAAGVRRSWGLGAMKGPPRVVPQKLVAGFSPSR